jgi:hypothetical protein
MTLIPVLHCNRFQLKHTWYLPHCPLKILSVCQSEELDTALEFDDNHSPWHTTFPQRRSPKQLAMGEDIQVGLPSTCPTHLRISETQFLDIRLLLTSHIYFVHRGFLFRHP